MLNAKNDHKSKWGWTPEQAGAQTDPGALTGAMTLRVVLKASRSTSSSTSLPRHAPGSVTMDTPIR